MPIPSHPFPRSYIIRLALNPHYTVILHLNNDPLAIPIKEVLTSTFRHNVGMMHALENLLYFCVCHAGLQSVSSLLDYRVAALDVGVESSEQSEDKDQNPGYHHPA